MMRAFVLCAALAFAPSAAAQSPVEAFFRGRTLSLMVGFAPGGVNDISARLVARHLPKYLPGNPSIAVQNQPSAGGLVTTNFIYNAAPKDGSVIASLDRGSSQLAIQGDPLAKFDPQALTWLGSLSSFADDAYMLIVNAAVDARTKMGAMPTAEPKGELLLRFEPDTGDLFIAAKAFKDYCVKFQIHYRDALKQLKDEGVFIDTINKRMSKGMRVVSPAIRVLHFDASQSEFLHMDSVVHANDDRDSTVQD